MKKILALVLAMLLVMSSVAFAEDPAPVYKKVDLAEKNSNALDFDGTTDASGLDVKAPWSTYNMNDGTVGEIDTELWMQVAANGQIDVTVPLVLVFSTNIDGGDATAANNYKIVNNNNRNSISIDAINVNLVNNPNNTVSDKAMKLVGETEGNAWDASVRNEYYVTLNPEWNDGTKVAKTRDNNILQVKGEGDGWKYDLVKATGETSAYDKSGASEKNAVLFQIAQGEYVDMNPYMKTTPLTFVTAAYDSTEEKDVYSDSKGIELLNIVYTVSLKYSYADGVNTITTEGENLTGTGTAIAHTHNS